VAHYKHITVNGEDISCLVSRFPVLVPRGVSWGGRPAAKLGQSMQGFIARFMVFNSFYLQSRLLDPSNDVRVSALAPLVKNVIF